METPFEILTKRYGDVFLSKSENLNIVSENDQDRRQQSATVYTAVLETGAVNPTVLAVLVNNSADIKGAYLRDLKWSSIHVRSFNSWNEVVASGMILTDTEAQKPVSGSLNRVKDLTIRAVEESKNSKVYEFQDRDRQNLDLGRLTVFTSSPGIATGGNDLPRKTTFLPMLATHNFVYEL